MSITSKAGTHRKLSKVSTVLSIVTRKKAQLLRTSRYSLRSFNNINRHLRSIGLLLEI